MSNPLDADPHMQVNNEEIEGQLRDIANIIGSTLPKGWGFMLQIFSFGPGGSTFYISNAQREDIISNLRELADNLEKGKA